MWIESSRKLLAACDPDRPDAWRAPSVMSVLRDAATKLPSDWRVVARVGNQSWLVTAHAILSETGQVARFADRVGIG
jgi:hypothetical protein